MDLCTTYGVQNTCIIDRVHPDHAIVNYWLSQGFLVSCAFRDKTPSIPAYRAMFRVIAESFDDATVLPARITRDHIGVVTVETTLVYFCEEMAVVEVSSLWIRTYLTASKVMTNRGDTVTVQSARDSVYGAFATASERGFERCHPSGLPWEILAIRDPAARRAAAEAFRCSST